MITGAEMIADERQRQIDIEGYDAQHDDAYHADGSLAKAAEAYLHAHDPGVHCGNAPSSWPFDPKYCKPSVNPIRNLVKAGALIAAEIERLQRAQNP